MVGKIVKLKVDGRRCLVKRDGINNFGRRQLRLRALDGGPLLFVEPDEVILENAGPEPSTSTGQDDKESVDEGGRQGKADGGSDPQGDTRSRGRGGKGKS